MTGGHGDTETQRHRHTHTHTQRVHTETHTQKLRTEGLVEGHSVQLHAGLREAAEVGVGEVVAHLQPDLVRQTQPLRELPRSNTRALKQHKHGHSVNGDRG